MRPLKGFRRFVQPMDRATDVLAQFAAFPFADLATIVGEQPILILAPHPDDESLGCGGLIAQACAAGAEVHVAVLTDGTQSHPHSPSHPAARLKALREDETRDATAVLGLPPERLHFLEYPDTLAPRRGQPLRDAGQRLAEFVTSMKIGTVFSSWEHDPHCDHLAAHRVTVEASRLKHFRHLSYAVWGWTLPDTKWLKRVKLQGYRLNVMPNLPVKRQAISCHRSQMTDLISDDATAFRLPEHLLALCDRPFEAFLMNGA